MSNEVDRLMAMAYAGGETHMNALRAEVARLALDAERYRWLRELPNADSLNLRFMGSDLDGVVDAEIDAARGAAQKGKT